MSSYFKQRMYMQSAQRAMPTPTTSAMSTFSNYIKGFLKLNYSIDGREASFVRVVYALYLLFINGLPNFTHLGGLPSFFYFPRMMSINSIISSFPSSEFILGIQSLSFVALLCLLIGYRTFWSSITFAVSQIVLHSFLFSLGKLNHNFILYLMPICLAFNNWGNYFSVDELRNRKTKFSSNTGISILAVSLAFIFFTSAYAKIAGHWLNWNTSPLQHILLNKGVLDPEFLHQIPDWLYEIAEWGTVAFELAFLILYPLRRVFYLNTYVALFFHFMVALTLGISFLALPIVYFTFQAFQLREWLEKLNSRKIVRVLLIPLAAALFLAYIPYFLVAGNPLFSKPLLQLLTDWLTLPYPIIVFAILLVFPTTLWWNYRKVRR